MTEYMYTIYRTYERYITIDMSAQRKYEDYYVTNTGNGNNEQKIQG